MRAGLCEAIGGKSQFSLAARVLSGELHGIGATTCWT